MKAMNTYTYTGATGIRNPGSKWQGVGVGVGGGGWRGERQVGQGGGSVCGGRATVCVRKKGKGREGRVSMSEPPGHHQPHHPPDHAPPCVEWRERGR